MQTDLRSLFARIERQRRSLDNMAQEMKRAQLHWTWNANTWNANTWNTIQIIEHLVLSDETVGRAHQAGVSPQERWPIRFAPGFWRLALVLKALSRDFALQMPTLTTIHMTYHTCQMEILQSDPAFPRTRPAALHE